MLKDAFLAAASTWLMKCSYWITMPAFLSSLLHIALSHSTLGFERYALENSLTNLCHTKYRKTLGIAFHYIFIHSGYFYSASSSPVLLRCAPNYCIDTVSELTR